MWLQNNFSFGSFFSIRFLLVRGRGGCKAPLSPKDDVAFSLKSVMIIPGSLWENIFELNCMRISVRLTFLTPKKAVMKKKRDREQKTVFDANKLVSLVRDHKSPNFKLQLSIAFRLSIFHLF